MNKYSHYLISHTCHNHKWYVFFLSLCPEAFAKVFALFGCRILLTSLWFTMCVKVPSYYWGQKRLFRRLSLGGRSFSWNTCSTILKRSLKITRISLFSQGRVWGLCPKWSYYWCFIGSTGINEGRTWSLCTFHLENIRSWKRVKSTHCTLQRTYDTRLMK